MINPDTLYAEEICLLADVACRAKEKGMDEIYHLIYERLRMENERIYILVTQESLKVNIEH